MKILKEKLFTLHNLSFLILILFFLFWYGLTLTVSRISPPSGGMSNAKTIAELDYGFSNINNFHVLALPVPGSPHIQCILAVDGSVTQIFYLDLEGEILFQKELELNLSQASHLEAVFTDSHTIRLFYKHRFLFQVEIDLSDGSIDSRPLTDTLLSFVSYGTSLLVEREDGLYGFGESGPVPLISGPVDSYGMTGEGENLYILYSLKGGLEELNLELLECSASFKVQSRRELTPSENPKNYRDIRDLRVRDDVLTTLYLFRDRRYRHNLITLQRINLGSSGILQETRHILPYYKSLYRIIESNRDFSRFSHQIEDEEGLNIGGTTVFSDGSSLTDAYSKTRTMSKFGGAFLLDGYEAVVFSDIKYDKRVLQFASASPSLIEASGKFSSVGFWYPFSTTFFLYLVSLVTGGLYLLIVTPVPVITALSMDKLFTLEGKKIQFLITIAVMIIHTLIKIIITSNLVHKTSLYLFRPLCLEGKYLIYLLVIFMSFVSFSLTHRANRDYSYNDISYLDFYFRFALYDYFQYAAIFIMYIVHSILLGKI